MQARAYTSDGSVRLFRLSCRVSIDGHGLPALRGRTDHAHEQIGADPLARLLPSDAKMLPIDNRRSRFRISPGVTLTPQGDAVTGSAVMRIRAFELRKQQRLLHQRPRDQDLRNAAGRGTCGLRAVVGNGSPPTPDEGCDERHLGDAMH